MEPNERILKAMWQWEEIQELLQNGAETAFDIWYEWDKSLYTDDESFAALLDYVKERNIQTDF